MNNYIEQPITKTLETNYMPYAMSVIISRAIPEIDGFKPSHRKLLYTMYQMGLLKGNRRKSTNVVGETMKLNPHGDMAIYETLVRLTRGNDSLLTPFIDSKGNFGKQFSRDMAFAASRYTEVKLDSICQEIFKNIDKNTVDFVDNYDGTMKEPVLFPTTFPNILVTNNQGIAVSMASSICSFNLKEVCDATIKFIKNEKVDIKKYLKAPDFSSGGELIYNEKEIENIYKTGRGSFKLRGKYRVDKKNSLIEIYEIPYTTTIEAIIDKIISLVKSNKIKEINDVRNETDKNGLKITIDIKKSANPELLMHKLYSMTTLMDSFSCNFNVLVGGVPKTIGIKPILTEWLKFRIECIKRQTAYDLQKKKNKHHLLSGLAKILLDIDKAIRIIRDTEEDSMVIPNLIKGFKIDEQQAEYIAEIRLRNLNKEYLLNRIKEREQLEKDMKALEEIYESEELIKDIICTELKEIGKKYGKPRKTEIIYHEEVKEIEEHELIEDYTARFFLTKENYFKKVTLVSLRSSGEHKLKDEDTIIQEIEAINKSEIIFFSDKANVYKIKAYDIPEVKVSNIGHYLPNLLNMEDDENIIYFTITNDYKGHMLFVFENGKIAKVPLDAYQTKVNRRKLINAYNDKYKLINIKYILDDIDIILIRDNDKAILLNTDKIEEKSTKSSMGVNILNLKKNSKVTYFLEKDDFISDDIEYYRSKDIPSTGHFILDKDKNKNNFLK
ncbi:DNA topoisomerase (ATP-hydrolyzing) subunit A [uncultured Tyzzerella sp.]|uniref:DNA topoisomerase (ATP-hydrolyzing) subunit A n=1 Tax=uncultured Tyzzerella sp. TaxID=2321398 RepID=UPI002941D2AE|nr:DNA topoisomerase (ATP-hydrolyzing) subunit A [uncultured Tyzzerella sp.]